MRTSLETSGARSTSQTSTANGAYLTKERAFYDGVFRAMRDRILLELARLKRLLIFSR